ncbi:hypothetical protein [Dapis sp. BLCC M229]|uniref:hypothetical protein n=1 Tax=Dapis sp. BLCC M229 TaxID=3400188 RepID=UPI003CF2EF6E
MKGYKLGRKNQWQEAVFYLKKASHLADIPDWIFLNLGIAYEHYGNYQATISIYKNFSNNHHKEKPDKNNISRSEKLESIIPPPPEEIEILYEFVMLGSMRKIQERAVYLEELDQKYIPFAQHLKNLAQEFRDKEITDFVEKYLYQD